MGVRGKIEAVIYAAEEPVTLAQLAVLFGEEAVAERVAAELEPVPEPVPDAQWTLGAELAVEAEAQAVAIKQDVPQGIAEAPPEVEGEPVLLGDTDADRRAARVRDREARDAVRAVLSDLIRDYESDGRGMEIREIAGGYRIATKPEYHDAVRAFVKSLKPVMKLSLQALETLAVIAYKQPVTAPEVAEIRGVDSGGVLGSLISRKLVTTAGRKQVVGRPILYKTTKEFLLRFGLKDLAELPSMEEFEKMAGELQAIGEEAGGMHGEEKEEAGEPVTDLDDGLDDDGGQVDGAQAVRGERPALAPSEIKVDVEEPLLAGISVDEHGAAVPDPEPAPQQDDARESTGE